MIKSKRDRAIVEMIENKCDRPLVEMMETKCDHTWDLRTGDLFTDNVPNQQRQI